MIQILPLADIIHKEVLLEDDFTNKFKGWELIEDVDETLRGFNLKRDEGVSLRVFSKQVEYPLDSFYSSSLISNINIFNVWS